MQKTAQPCQGRENIPTGMAMAAVIAARITARMTSEVKTGQAPRKR